MASVSIHWNGFLSIRHTEKGHVHSEMSPENTWSEVVNGKQVENRYGMNDPFRMQSAVDKSSGGQQRWEFACCYYERGKSESTALAGRCAAANKTRAVIWWWCCRCGNNKEEGLGTKCWAGTEDGEWRRSAARLRRRGEEARGCLSNRSITGRKEMRKRMETGATRPPHHRSRSPSAKSGDTAYIEAHFTAWLSEAFPPPPPLTHTHPPSKPNSGAPARCALAFHLPPATPASPVWPVNSILCLSAGSGTSPPRVTLRRLNLNGNWMNCLEVIQPSRTINPYYWPALKE